LSFNDCYVFLVRFSISAVPFSLMSSFIVLLILSFVGDLLCFFYFLILDSDVLFSGISCISVYVAKLDNVYFVIF